MTGYDSPHAVKVWRILLPALQLWIILLGGLAAVSLASSWLGVEPLFQQLAGAVLVAGTVLIFCHRDRGVLGRLWRRSGLTGWNLLWTLLAAWFVVVAVLSYIRVLNLLGIQRELLFQVPGGSIWQVGGYLVLGSLSPAVFEELAFRGHIMNRLERVMGPVEALLVQAAMFSVLHLVTALFISHFLIGLILGELRRRTGSIFPCMLVHAGWNAVAILGIVG